MLLLRACIATWMLGFAVCGIETETGVECEGLGAALLHDDEGGCAGAARVRSVDRVPWTQLTTEQFQQQYALAGKPVVITGLASKCSDAQKGGEAAMGVDGEEQSCRRVAGSHWTLAHIREACGDSKAGLSKYKV